MEFEPTSNFALTIPLRNEFIVLCREAIEVWAHAAETPRAKWELRGARSDAFCDAVQRAVNLVGAFPPDQGLCDRTGRIFSTGFAVLLADIRGCLELLAKHYPVIEVFLTNNRERFVAFETGLRLLVE